MGWAKSVLYQLCEAGGVEPPSPGALRRQKTQAQKNTNTKRTIKIPSHDSVFSAMALFSQPWFCFPSHGSVFPAMVLFSQPQRRQVLQQGRIGVFALYSIRIASARSETVVVTEVFHTLSIRFR